MTDVTATTPSGSSALEKSPDARKSNNASNAFTASNPANQQALPTNRDKELKKIREEQAKKQAKQDKKKKKQDSGD